MSDKVLPRYFFMRDRAKEKQGVRASKCEVSKLVDTIRLNEVLNNFFAIQARSL